MRQGENKPMIRIVTFRLAAVIGVLLTASVALAQDKTLKIFISTDMEGVGGIGTSAMTNSDGKDYALGRKLMTAEVNTVVAAIFDHGPADILINDSHGDHRNLLHTELDARVEYIQGDRKILGMVQGLDDSFDAVIFLGYHARAGTEGGFIAHTGSGAVQGLWLNDIEVGEGGLNAAFAGSLGVPVVLAAGDRVFAEQFAALTGALTVATKEAVTADVAKLIHPEIVRALLKQATAEALADIGKAKPFVVGKPVEVRMRVVRPIRADVLMAVPGMRRLDGYSVAYQAKDMAEAYPLIRLMYKFIRP